VANPKYKHSRLRTRMRRAHDAVAEAGRSTCPNCKAVKMPHRVCPMCGHYKGREVVKLEETGKASS
jgi:large subunit ribosomal protein L32